MKKLLLFTFVIFNFSFLISSCHCKKKASKDTATTTTTAARDFEKEGYVKATVIDYGMSACKYIIKLSTEKKLEPSAPLAADFQKDNLDVWVKYAEKKNAVSSCMAGTVVDIADIQLRK